MILNFSRSTWVRMYQFEKCPILNRDTSARIPIFIFILGFPHLKTCMQQNRIKKLALSTFAGLLQSRYFASGRIQMAVPAWRLYKSKILPPWGEEGLRRYFWVINSYVVGRRARKRAWLLLKGCFAPNACLCIPVYGDENHKKNQYSA